MPEPIDYRIILSLQTALAAISVVSGYHYDVAAGAVKLDRDHEVDALIAPTGPRPFILFALGDERWEYQPAMRLKKLLPVEILWVHDTDPTDDTSYFKTYFRGCADVEQAITRDLTRGGLAVDTRIRQRTLEALGSQIWAGLSVEIVFLRNYGQPNG